MKLPLSTSWVASLLKHSSTNKSSCLSTPTNTAKRSTLQPAGHVRDSTAAQRCNVVSRLLRQTAQRHRRGRPPAHAGMVLKCPATTGKHREGKLYHVGRSVVSVSFPLRKESKTVPGPVESPASVKPQRSKKNFNTLCLKLISQLNTLNSHAQMK